VLTEAFYFLNPSGKGWDLWHFVFGRKLLLHFSFRGDVTIVELTRHDAQRTGELMETYGTLPMDLADASFVAVAERLKLSKIFTLHHHFRVYRPRHAPL